MDFLFLFGLFNFEELHPSLSSESLLSEFNPSSGVEDRVEDEEELPQEVSNVKTGFTVGLSPMQSSISLWNFQVFFLPSGLTVVFNFLLL